MGSYLGIHEAGHFEEQHRYTGHRYKRLPLKTEKAEKTPEVAKYVTMEPSLDPNK